MAVLSPHPNSAKIVALGRPGASSPRASSGALHTVGAIPTLDARYWLRERRMRRAASLAVLGDDFELIHLLDARLAPLGDELRQRLGEPVTADLTTSDLTSGSRTRGTMLAALEQLDAVFVTDGVTRRMLRESAPWSQVTVLPLIATQLPRPHARTARAARRALARVGPGRFVIGVPAGLVNHVRAFIGELLPAIEVDPLCVVFGVPAGRDVSRVLAHRNAVRVVRGELTTVMISALAPFVDAFVVPPGCCGRETIDAQRCLDLTMSGVPVIASSEMESSSALRHEQNAILVEDRRDAWCAALNGLFALPPPQRQALGESFAAESLARYPLSAARQAYHERFDALLGRPQIPLELRAA